MDVRPPAGGIPFAPDPSDAPAPGAGAAAAPGTPPAGADPPRADVQPGSAPPAGPSAQGLDARLGTALLKRELLGRAAGLTAGQDAPPPPDAASAGAAPDEPAVRGFGPRTVAGPDGDEIYLPLSNLASGTPGPQSGE